ncbi:MAG: DUF6470 family protein [Bacillota bacterium]
MEFPQIAIHQRAAKLGLNERPPVLELDNKLEELRLEESEDSLEINVEDAELKVDNYPALYDLGYRNIEDAGRDIAEKGRETWLESVGQYARNGDRLMKFQENDVADIAAEEAKAKEKELNIKHKRGPEVNFTEHGLEIEHLPKEIRGEYTGIHKLNRPGIDLTRGRVKTYLRQEASLEFEYRGSVLDQLA